MKTTSTDHQLNTDIEKLRGEFPDTKALYREVAILMFFRYGQTPTTNRLYQLVRKGSMNTVATVLNEFWATLRDRSRVDITHAGIPDSLKTHAGDLVHAIWQQASIEARKELESITQESQAAIAKANTLVSEKDNELSLIAKHLADARAAVEAADTDVAKATKLLELEKREHAGTTAKFDAAVAEALRLQAALDAARHDFAEELGKVRAAAQESAIRLDAVERRAHLEVERERQARKEADAQVTALRKALSEHTASSAAKVESLTAELGELRGHYHATQANNTALNAEVARLQAHQTELSEKLVAATVRLESAETSQAKASTTPLKKRVGVAKSKR